MPCPETGTSSPAAVAVTALSNRLFSDDIDPAKDRISSAKDDEWNRKMLEFLADGRLEDVAQLSREIHRQVRVKKVVNFKPIWWLSAVMGQHNNYDGHVFDYAPLYGAGGAVVARELAEAAGCELHETDITEQDLVAHLERVVYHLDYPVAGPGSFPQYMVARSASRHRKVVLGGQGGDEIFGGYARYLIAYFEQCIKAAIDGTMHNGHFVVTYESIIPNLSVLRQYKPLLQEFWRKGLFEDLDRRYFRLINRARDLGEEINWEDRKSTRLNSSHSSVSRMPSSA